MKVPGNWVLIARSLRHRDHRLFNMTLAPSMISIWALRTGVGWLAWELTGSPTWLGIIAAADLLPAILLAPFAGAIADRASPVKMMRLTQSIITLHALILSLMTLTGVIDIWGLLALQLMTGLVQPFSTSARMVFFPTLVPRHELGTAIAINSTIFNAGRAIGPAIAGVMIGPFGVVSVFLLNFVSFFLHSLNLMRIGRHTPPRTPRPRKSMGREILDGLHYVRRDPGLGPILLLLVVVSVVSRPLIDMLPGFADVVFARGAEGLGWLLSTFGIGGLVGAVWLAQRGPIRGLTRLVLLSSLMIGLFMAAFAHTGLFWLALPLLFMIGFLQIVSGTGTQTLMQNAVDDAYRGRVMSLYALVYRGTPALGAIAIGLLAEAYGLALAITLAGGLCLLAWAMTVPRLRRMSASLERDTTPREPS